MQCIYFVVLDSQVSRDGSISCKREDLYIPDLIGLELLVDLRKLKRVMDRCIELPPHVPFPSRDTVYC